MVQRAVRAEGTTPLPADSSAPDGAGELGRDWVVLKDCRLGLPSRGGHLPAVLMHPARGVAVLDILPADTPGAAETLRAKLAAARFPAIFAGHLPVVHLQVAPRRMRFLPSLLDDAFAAQPPLNLPGGDAWVGVAARALKAEQPPAAPRFEAPPRPSSEVVAGRRTRRRTAATLRNAGAVLLCLAALGGALGWALGRAPEPTQVPGATPASIPVPPADAGPAPAATVEAVTQAPQPALPKPVPDAPPPRPARAARSEAAAVAPPVPVARSPAPPPLALDVPPPPSLPADIPLPPPPPPQPPAARRAPEGAASRRQQQDSGTAQPAAAAAVAAAARSPETPPDRCRRVSALVGSGAPLAEADMRFFNGNCIRWE